MSETVKIDYSNDRIDSQLAKLLRALILGPFGLSGGPPGSPTRIQELQQRPKGTLGSCEHNLWGRYPLTSDLSGSHAGAALARHDGAVACATTRAHPPLPR